jgi:GNAT superfamily N-acetyltransferase
MIQLGEDKYKATLQEMWKLCFPEDTDDFIRFYFDKVHKNEENLIYVENKKPVASLQMIPYSLKTGDVISMAGYISGAMTHPDSRRKGYMAKLLNASFNVMKAKGYAYTFLIPQEEWLFGFYEKYGYLSSSPAFAEKESADTCRNSQVPAPLPMEEVREEKWWKLYSRFLMEKTNVVLKTETQFSNILWNFFYDGGILFANDEGLAFTLKKGHQIILKEFFYSDETIKQEFIKSIRDYYAQPNLTITDRSTGRRGMIKSLDASKEVVTNIYINMMLD